MLNAVLNRSLSVCFFLSSLSFLAFLAHTVKYQLQSLGFEIEQLSKINFTWKTLAKCASVFISFALSLCWSPRDRKLTSIQLWCFRTRNAKMEWKDSCQVDFFRNKCSNLYNYLVILSEWENAKMITNNSISSQSFRFDQTKIVNFFINMTSSKKSSKEWPIMLAQQQAKALKV